MIVDSQGGLGPSAPEPRAGEVLDLTAAEGEILEEDGFVFRLRHHGEGPTPRARPGAQLLITAEIVVFPRSLLSETGVGQEPGEASVLRVPFLTALGSDIHSLAPLFPGSEQAGGGRKARRGGSYRVWLPVILGPSIPLPEGETLDLRVRLQGVLERDGKTRFVSQERVLSLPVDR